MRKIGFVILLIIVMGFVSPKTGYYKVKPIERGTLLLTVRPAALDSFFSGNTIRISYVRKVCNFLTDNDITQYNGFAVPRRKKAVIRHVKQIYETIERTYVEQKPVDRDLEENFYELALLYESFKQKAIADTKIIGRKEKIRMIKDARKSRRLFQYKNEITSHEALNVNADSLDADPYDSPFWHQPKSSYYSSEFDRLASLKKIRVEADMVVLFDKASLSGSSPKIDVLDLDLDNGWSVKWGDEVHTDIVGSRIFAELGYDVDHPYYFGPNRLTVVFDDANEIKNANDLKNKVKTVYGLDLAPFISASGTVSAEMVFVQEELKKYIGRQYVRFIECSMEARPDRVKRLGSFLPDLIGNSDRRELRGALLAHEWIGNWDTREENTMLSVIHMGDYRYRMSGVFSDLGTGFGISQHLYPADFKVGLVNEFEWEIAHRKDGIVYLDGEINSILPCYAKASYRDLLWMAKKIAAVDSFHLRSIIEKSGWPAPLRELYFHKLASRRASILAAFQVADPNPIPFDKNLNIKILSTQVVSEGKLLVDYEKEKNPESFLGSRGRFRNYGH